MSAENKSYYSRIYKKSSIFSMSIFLIGIFIYNSVFYFFPTFFQKITGGTYVSEIHYNELLSSKGSGNIEVLEKGILQGREAIKLELIGDTYHVRGGDMQSIKYYEQSLEEEENDRVRHKLSILTVAGETSAPTGEEGDQKNSSGTQSQSGNQVLPEIESAQMRSKESEKNRGKYIHKSYDSYIIKDTKDFLDFGIERKDW